MGAVIIGLCITKHKQISQYGRASSSGATDARTDAYVEAQAAHMNMIYGTSAYRNRSSTVLYFIN